MSAERLARPTRALGIVLLLLVVPFALGHRVLSDVLASFHASLTYLPEVAPWLLLLAGGVLLVPVAVSSGLHPESRFYPRGRRGLFTFGVCLYVLGGILALEVSSVWSLAH